jgi:Mrp family chromosome partitioning ATPase
MPLTAEYRLLVPRAAWMAARARNAMHRPIFIGAVSVGTFITALVALVVMPQQAQRRAEAIAPKAGERPDTTPMAERVIRTESQLAVAESTLAASRTKSALLAQAAIDTLNPALGTRRDSLVTRVAELERLLARTETAPLAGSYRALGESAELAANARVKTLLDSLADIERGREAIGTSGGADALSVALTSRATEIGRSIQAVAAQRRDAMRAEIATLAPPQRPSVVERAEADTVRRVAARDSLRSAVAMAIAELGRARRTVQELDRRAERAREVSSMSAPPYALLASAIVFGIVLGFGAALLQELRRPRIANKYEAERVTGVRVISVIRPRPPSPERGRRLADRIAPPHIDPGNDAHQLVWLFVAPPASSFLMVTVTGDDPAVAAIVAANLGAVAADEARNVLVVDTDASSCPVASALRVPARPGLDAILDGRLSWPEATQHATIGRDRVVDVVPSGTGVPAPAVSEISNLLQREAARLARHYDTVLVVSSREQTLGGLPGVLPMHDVIYCAHMGHTKLADLKKAVDGIRRAGGNPRGIVLWDDAPPALLTPDELAAGSRPLRTAEMEAFVAGRAR